MTLATVEKLATVLGCRMAGLWKALADAVACSGERSRLALDCLQLRGEGGRVAATDVYQALLQSGFEFPWESDLLVPALPLLGCKELDADEGVMVGKGGEHVFVATGPWTVALKVEAGCGTRTSTAACRATARSGRG